MVKKIQKKGFGSLGAIVSSAFVALVVALAVGFYFRGSFSAGGGGSSFFAPPLFIQGYSVSKDGVVHNEKVLTLTSDNDQVAWQNTGPKDVYVNLATLTTSGTASSTYRVYAIATSTASIPNTHDYTALVASSSLDRLISGITLSTSTQATTTNNVQAARDGFGNGLIKVRKNWYLIVYLQASAIPTCTGLCETATSTNTGVKPVNLTFHYWYDD